MEQNMEYPFGFGFELMRNPRAMERLEAMGDQEKRAVMKRVSEAESPEEIRRILGELAGETTKKSGARRTGRSPS